MSNVERRMSNVEGGNFEWVKEMNVECRTPNIECRRKDQSKWK